MKFWPPKAKPPFPLYFSLCLHFAPPAREPTMVRPNPITGTLRGAIGSCGAMHWGRRWHAHGMRGLSRRGYGKGGSFWLLLCVVDVLCGGLLLLLIWAISKKSEQNFKWSTYPKMFCSTFLKVVDQTTVPFFFHVVIFSSFVIIGVCILSDRRLSEIYFNRWPDDRTFFFWVKIISGCNLNPPKNMDFNHRPDDCTFFFRVVIFFGCNLNPPKNMAGQMTVPFFSGSIFFRLYVSTKIGARVKIRTPITTRKNYDRKKRYSHLAGYFFEPPEKITTKKKRCSCLTNGWNKSQITVCCVKIRTHQLRLEKIMTEKKVQYKSSGRLSCQNTNTSNHSLI